MAKSSYLLKLLPAAAVFFYSYAGSADVSSAVIQEQEQHQVVPVLLPADKRQIVKAIYDAQTGVRETGINGGDRVEEYLRYAGLKKGDPWCAAFVCWVLGQAAIPNPGSGWSPALFPQAKVIWQRKTLFRRIPGSKLPQTGDVFGIWFPEKNRIAHAGFVDEWQDNWVITVEGNTNLAGSREGDGVYRKKRLIRSVYSVSSYIR